MFWIGYTGAPGGENGHLHGWEWYECETELVGFHKGVGIRNLGEEFGCGWRCGCWVRFASTKWWHVCVFFPFHFCPDPDNWMGLGCRVIILGLPQDVAHATFTGHPRCWFSAFHLHPIHSCGVSFEWQEPRFLVYGMLCTVVSLRLDKDPHLLSSAHLSLGPLLFHGSWVVTHSMACMLCMFWLNDFISFNISRCVGMFNK